MTRSPGGWVALAACALLLAACPSGSDPDSPDAGLAEPGDAVDPGPLAPCRFTSPAGVPCGDPATFNLSLCQRATLAEAPTHGIYNLATRYENAALSTGGAVFANVMHLVDDGGTSLVAGGQATAYTRDDQGFYIARDTFLSDGGTTRTAYAGCQLSGGGKLTGCYAFCRNGTQRSRGTFEATRMTWRESELESAGLSLVSESFVALGLPVDIYVAKGHAYVVSVNARGRTGGLTVFDVADPAQPVFRRTVTMPGDGYWNGVWARGDALYVASAARGVLVFDISQPEEPAFVANVPSDPINVHTVFVEGERLYAMSPSPHSETLLFDISQPREPRLLNRFTAPGGLEQGYVHDAFAYQGRLYINHWDLGYLIADVGDPSHIRWLGQYVYARQSSHANAVGTFDERTIAFEGGEGYDTRLRVLDVTDPSRVVKLGEWQLRPQASIHNMVLVGTRLYIAYYQEGVRVLDVSDLSQPRPIAWFNTFRETDFERGYSLYEGAIGMRVPGDGHLYVVDTSRGLLIFREP